MPVAGFSAAAFVQLGLFYSPFAVTSVQDDAVAAF